MAMAMCSWLQSVEDEPVTDSNSDEALLVKKDESYFLRVISSTCGPARVPPGREGPSI